MQSLKEAGRLLGHYIEAKEMGHPHIPVSIWREVRFFCQVDGIMYSLVNDWETSVVDKYIEERRIAEKPKKKRKQTNPSRSKPRSKR